MPLFPALPNSDAAPRPPNLTTASTNRRGEAVAHTLLPAVAMAMRWKVPVLVSVLLLAVVLAPAAVAQSDSVAASCPGYVAYLRSARTHLARGERSRALAELRHAQDALEGCLSEATGPIGLAARAGRGPVS